MGEYSLKNITDRVYVSPMAIGACGGIVCKGKPTYILFVLLYVHWRVVDAEWHSLEGLQTKLCW